MIPITKPLLGNEEADAAREAVLSGWVSQGGQVAAFEEEFASYVGAVHACAVSNCTTALHLALLAVGAGRDDEIITVSHSFIASANAIRQCGAIPVFVDIEEDGYNIDPNLIEQAVTSQTRAILCVHQMGMPCDMAAILEVARAHGLPVIEDAACGIGAEIQIDEKWQRIGQPIGDIVCFSFHPRKVITTGEGGMLTTNREDFDALFRLWRQHGMSISDRARHASAAVVFEDYPVQGFNYRMTDIQASIGRLQLKRLDGIVANRRRLAAAYTAALSAIAGVNAPREPEWARSNWQSYCVRLAKGIDQLHLMQGMLDAGIATRRGIMNMHQEAAHEDLNGRFDLQNSEIARDGSVILPLYPQMTHEEHARVVSTLDVLLACSGQKNGQVTAPALA